ncbi:hypothetical protein ACFYY2_30620 [Streptomyces sp. NPDC001822]|uniref:hypothetical protein n=1 Tax=Streptomyces sp. NPDC001822 TaxID=3364614 RepID=UPI0036753A17
MGGTMKGLVRGVPLVAAPQAVDQLVTLAEDRRARCRVPHSVRGKPSPSARCGRLLPR